MLISLPFGLEIVLRRPELLWLLAILPFLWWLAVYEGRIRKKTLQDPWIQLHLASSHLPTGLARIRWWMGASIAFVLLTVIIATPDRKIIEQRSVYGMVRVTFLLDSSLSMIWGEDVEPNRLAAAKSVIENFVNTLWFNGELKGSYAMALIPFAGAAQPFYLPFTTSREQFVSNLEQINQQTVRKKGTSVWAALRAYDELLLSRPAAEKGTLDLAILISDGGKEEGKGTEKLLLPQLMKELLDPYRAAVVFSDTRMIIRSDVAVRKVMVITIGVGKVAIDNMGNQVSVPVPLIIRDKTGNFVYYYREDENNPKSAVLASRLDENILKDIARMGGGSYMHFSQEGKLLQELKALVLRYRQETGKVPEIRYDALRMWFLVPAMLLCCILFGYAEPYVRMVRTYLLRVSAKR